MLNIDTISQLYNQERNPYICSPNFVIDWQPKINRNESSYQSITIKLWICTVNQHCII